MQSNLEVDPIAKVVHARRIFVLLTNHVDDYSDSFVDIERLAAGDETGSLNLNRVDYNSDGVWLLGGMVTV